MKIAQKRLILIFTALVLLSIVVTTIIITYSWYVSSSNDASGETDEMMTLAQGYGGHFSTEEEYTNFTGIYEHSESTQTSAYVKPGDVIYYAFLFDINIEDGLKTNYTLELVLNAGSDPGTYHSVSTGNYTSLLNHLIIEENSCHFYQLSKSYDQDEDDNVYESYNDSDYYESPDFTNTESSFYENNVAGATLSLKMPTISTYPEDADGKAYFMIFIPIWYQDTNQLQNNELDCYVKLSSTILTETQA